MGWDTPNVTQERMNTMKRALSLLLTFAMVMSLFTTAAFAAGESERAPVPSGKVTSITYKNGTVEHPVEFADNTITVYEAAGKAANLKEDNFTFTPATTEKIFAERKTKLNLKFTGDSTEYYTTVATQQISVKLVPASGSALSVEGTNVLYTGTKPDATALGTGLVETVENDGSLGLTATLKIASDGTTITADIKNADGTKTWFSNVNTGYTLVKGTTVSLSVTNGSYITANTLVNAVKNAIGVSSLASLTLTVSNETNGLKNGIGIYNNTSTPLNNTSINVIANSNVTIQSTAGTIGERTFAYSTGSVTGVIKVNSVYASAITVSQTASFAKEEFRVDYISGIESLGVANATSKGTVYGYNSTYGGYGVSLITSGTTSATYTGYSASNVAQQVTVNFTYPAYDIVTYDVDDGEVPFDADVFQTFAANVVAEQLGTTYSGYLDKVKISNVSAAGYYTLYNGSKVLGVNEALTPAQLETITMDVVKTGTYTINFTADYKYYLTSSVTPSTYSNIVGCILIYAGDNGDLVYEVTHGDSVSFRSVDFQALYQRLKSNNSSTLTSVTVLELPIYGDLYTINYASTANKAQVGDIFYVSPIGAQKNLNGLTYLAVAGYEYTDYVPVRLYGSAGYVDAIVEIEVVDDAMPFLDIPENHTFYEYIKYVNKHNIMGGKTVGGKQVFDPTSSISRIQLAVTLYRMAGSPTTYNYTTLPFTDLGVKSEEFLNALKWAYSMKIIGGVSATEFAPDVPVNRQAMVTMLYRYAKTTGYSVGTMYNNHLGYYTDGGKVSSDMKEAMNWALDYQLLSGKAGNKLDPRGSTTRGAAAKILANFHKIYVG